MIRFDFEQPKLYFSGTTCTALIHLWMLPRMEIGPASFVLSNSDTKTSRKNKKKLLRSKTIFKKNLHVTHIQQNWKCTSYIQMWLLLGLTPLCAHSYFLGALSRLLVSLSLCLMIYFLYCVSFLSNLLFLCFSHVHVRTYFARTRFFSLSWTSLKK